MSILLVEIVSEGLIFGADRNITHTRERLGSQVIQILGQSQRRKVLRWPNRKALIGYAGAGEIGGMPTDEWLYNFIGENLDFPSLAELSESLCRRVQDQRIKDERGAGAELLILHVGGFEKRDGLWVPLIWHIRNTYDDSSGYKDIRKEFLCSEVKWNEVLPGVPLNQLRAHFGTRATSYDPFWIHQGEDLGTFNTIEAFLKGAFKVLCEQSHAGHSFPQTLSDWERQVRMSILTYGAYFEAFKDPGEQLVGGGVDTVVLPWPVG